MHNLSLPYDQADHLRTLMSKRKSVANPALPHVWTIVSGKGGVGKSVFAVGMAMTLAKSGRKVLLVDSDENLGKLDVLTGAAPKYRINDILLGKTSIDDAVYQSSRNVFMICGNSGSLEYPEISSSDRDYLYSGIVGSTHEFSDIIFDTAAGLRDDVLQYASYANDIVLISNSEPTAIMDAYAAVKIISRKVHSARFNLIMNNVHQPLESDEAAQKLQKAAEHFLKQEIVYIGFIPFDESVADSVKAQIPLLKKYPTSSSALCIQAAAQRLLLEETMEEPQTSTVYV